MNSQSPKKLAVNNSGLLFFLVLLVFSIIWGGVLIVFTANFSTYRSDLHDARVEISQSQEEIIQLKSEINALKGEMSDIADLIVQQKKTQSTIGEEYKRQDEDGAEFVKAFRNQQDTIVVRGNMIVQGAIRSEAVSASNASFTTASFKEFFGFSGGTGVAFIKDDQNRVVFTMGHSGVAPNKLLRWNNPEAYLLMQEGEIKSRSGFTPNK